MHFLVGNISPRGETDRWRGLLGGFTGKSRSPGAECTEDHGKLIASRKTAAFIPQLQMAAAAGDGWGLAGILYQRQCSPWKRK